MLGRLILLALLSIAPSALLPVAHAQQLPTGAHRSIQKAGTGLDDDPPDAGDRIKIIPPEHELLLLRENKIRIKFRVTGIQTMLVWPDKSDTDIDESTRELPIHFDHNGFYVNFIPRTLGKVTINFGGKYPDGGVFWKNVQAEVIPGDLKPTDILIGDRVNPEAATFEIVSSMDSDPNFVIINATYAGLKEPVRIATAPAAFKIRTPDNKPIFKIDQATGTITPLVIGYAVLETHIENFTRLSCVIVQQSQKPDVSTFTASDCKKLLHPGESLPFPDM